MSRYAPRLRVRIEHGYYAQARPRGLRFGPSAQTADWLRVHDAVWRETGDGLDLSAPPQSAAQPTPLLYWWACSDDALWANITGPLADDAGHLPCLRPATAAQPDGPTLALHTGAAVGTDTLWPLALPGTLAGQDPEHALPRRPLFVLGLPAPDLQGQPLQGASYRAVFAARALPWQYRLMGDWAGAELHVEDVSPGLADPSAALTFDPATELPLGSGPQVLTIRSQQPIALQERPERRFQLRSRSAAADRVLVKRLPMAGADHFVRETIGGQATLVSEIFVHR